MFLAPDLKRTSETDVHWPLRKWTDANFGPEAVQDHVAAFESVQRLREDIRTIRDKTPTNRDMCLKYVGVLNSMELRFPISERDIRITFQWHDSFQPKRKAESFGLVLEKAAVLFNAAALDAQMGSGQDLTSEDGPKTASEHFMRAAGTLDELLELLKTHTHEKTTADLTVDCVSFLRVLMLAQAQECFYHKAAAKLSPKVVSLVAAQSAIYYEEALSMASKAGVPNKWKDHLTARHGLMLGMASYYHSFQLEAEGKPGECQGRLQHANELLHSSKLSGKALKNFSVPEREAIIANQKLVGEKLRKAKKENETIYFAKVPAPSALGPVPARSTVQPEPCPAELLHVKGAADPFGRLVPFAIHESVKAYQEQRDSMVRAEADAMQAKNEAVREALARMNLPGALDAVLASGQAAEAVPRSVQDKAAEVRAKGGAQGLLQLVQTKRSLAAEDVRLLKAAKAALDAEEQEDTRFRQTFGQGRWSRTPSHSLNSSLRQEAAKYEVHLQTAQKSDSYVDAKLQGISEDLQRLGGSPQDLASLLPPPSARGQTNPHTQQLQQCITALDALIAHRMGIMEQLRQQASADDITNALLHSQYPAESVFAQELGKYQELREALQANYQQQEKQLQITQQVNTQFVASKSGDQTQAAREAAFQRIDAVFATFTQLQGNLSEGVTFYTDLQSAVARFKRKVDDFAFARQTEAAELSAHLSGQAAAPAYGKPLPVPGGPGGAVATASPHYAYQGSPQQQQQQQQPARQPAYAAGGGGHPTQVPYGQPPPTYGYGQPPPGTQDPYQQQQQQQHQQQQQYYQGQGGGRAGGGSGGYY